MPAPHALQRMEIWGGNHAADAGVSTPGLDLWVCSRPHEHAVSGRDVHYVSLCASGVITRFILADISDMELRLTNWPDLCAI
jgi:hypothetical protein